MINIDLTDKKLKLAALYGLVVCGGRSSRMYTDKSMLTYYEKPQRYHVYEMLQPICEKVFISCNNEQANFIEAGYKFLPDNAAYQNIGPMAALLTAFDQFPGKDILFIGCDYPFLTAADLQDFSASYKNGQPAAFYNEQEDLYEPLLACYPVQAVDTLKKMHVDGQYSLQQFLKNNHAIKYYPKQVISIQSIDTRESFLHAYNTINSS